MSSRQLLKLLQLFRGLGLHILKVWYSEVRVGLMFIHWLIDAKLCHRNILINDFSVRDFWANLF